MKRRTFLLSALGAAMTTQSSAKNVFIRGKDVSYEPDAKLNSTGLRIQDAVELMEKREADNTAPVLREEILDNPDAVFFIPAGVNDSHNWGGSWNSCNDQMERLGGRVGSLLFQKGAYRGGKTFIKPNMVGGIRKAGQSYNTGGFVHPNFTVGLVDTLHDLGNSNVAIGARGAMRHEHFVESGLMDLFNSHDLPLVEAHVQYFKHYKKSELVWHDNPNGMVARRFCTYRPVFEYGTTFINLAHAHVHKVGYTTLTIKNLQGVIPERSG